MISFGKKAETKGEGQVERVYDNKEKWGRKKIDEDKKEEPTYNNATTTSATGNQKWGRK